MEMRTHNAWLSGAAVGLTVASAVTYAIACVVPDDGLPTIGSAPAPRLGVAFAAGAIAGGAAAVVTAILVRLGEASENLSGVSDSEEDD